MKVYEGIVHLIGTGTWQNGSTRHTVLEIGDKALKNIGLNDYLSNYVSPGNYVRVLIYSSAIVAVENNNRKYKWSLRRILFASFLKAIFVGSIISFIIGFALHLEFIASLLVLGYCIYEIKNIIDFTRF